MQGANISPSLDLIMSEVIFIENIQLSQILRKYSPRVSDFIFTQPLVIVTGRYVQVIFGSLAHCPTGILHMYVRSQSFNLIRRV